jgi:hypothetical protein
MPQTTPDPRTPGDAVEHGPPPTRNGDAAPPRSLTGEDGTANIGEWITALWLIACLAAAVVATAIGFVQRDLTTFSLWAVACGGLVWLMAISAGRRGSAEAITVGAPLADRCADGDHLTRQP